MIARAEVGGASTNMAEFDAADIARGVGELYDPLADEKGVALTIDAAEAVPLRGHRELVTQALANLVDNAIKYAARPREGTAGSASAVVVTARSEDDQVLLTVADNGPGIAEADRGRVVERFCGSKRAVRSRVPASASASSRRSAHLHGGELRFEDNAPGLRAVLALPRGSRPLPTPAD